jgi:hypothetical protein
MLLEDYYAMAAVPLDDGSWVPSKVKAIAEVISDFFPDLEVRWLPRDKRRPGDAAYQIIEKTRDGAEVVAFVVNSEEEFDERLLKKIFESDASRCKNGPLEILEKLDAHNNAIKALKLKEQNNALEAANEFTKSVLRSPLNRYQHNGYRYDLPSNEQPKKVIVDVGVRYKTPRKAGIWR